MIVSLLASSCDVDRTMRRVRRIAPSLVVMVFVSACAASGPKTDPTEAIHAQMEQAAT